jgi:flagella basal body P-ring formation protein FlgA
MGDVRLGQVGSQMVSPGDWIATTSITVGTPLTSLVVVARPDALAGTEVTLRVRSGALEIRSDARLLRDARVGDQVRVFVASTNRVVDGRLVDATTVER